MLRGSLARSALRSSKRVAASSRLFSATAQRAAEVELTIGEANCTTRAIEPRDYANGD
jgi:hypothetical protein